MRYSNLIAIMAITQDGILGYQDKMGNEHLPFDEKLEGDMARVKRLTTNNSIIVGRKTFTNTLFKGKPVFPLPNRENIVMTRDSNFDESSPNVIRCSSLNSALAKVKKNKNTMYYVFGGSEIYELFRSHVNQTIITIAREKFNRDREDLGTDIPLHRIEDYMEINIGIESFKNNNVYLSKFKDSVSTLIGNHDFR